MIQQLFLKKYSVIPAVIFSGLCYYLSTGLRGDYWFLLWIAPVPVLLYSRFHSKTASFFAALTVFLLSKANVFFYFLKVLPPVPAAVSILLLSFAFALIILLNKIITARIKQAAGIFVFPVLYTSFEFLAGLTLPDGSFGSIAYTQTDAVWLVQIASVTGLYGVTFFVSLFASFFAELLPAKTGGRKISAFIFPLLLLALVPVFGFVRVNFRHEPNKVSLKAALFKVDSLPGVSVLQPKDRDFVLQEYSNRIESIHEKIDLILLPEKMMELRQDERAAYDRVFESIASNKNALVVAGLKIKKDRYANIAAVYFPDGKRMDYQKKYLVQGWERDFERGSQRMYFRFRNILFGAAVCKDMDFPGWIRGYAPAALLLVPAWDFQDDHWLHSRMAVMRGVENGFTVIRAAREGDLTISDPLGRVISQKVYQKNEPEDFLLFEITGTKLRTIYSKIGDGFCWLNLAALVILAVYSLISKKRSPERF